MASTQQRRGGGAGRRPRGRMERRSARNKIVIAAMAGLMALSLLAVPLTELLAGSDADTAAPESGEELLPAVQGPYDEPFGHTIDPAGRYRATLVTDLGEIVVELDPSGATVATNNLVNLADHGYYDGVVFHRVIEGFVVQSGDPTGTGMGGPGYTFADELGPARALVEEHGGYPRGTFAMANAGPDTNGSQFFIVQGELVELPAAYTVFGTVVDGMDVVDAVASVPVDAADRPFDPVTVRTIEIDAT